MKFRELDKTWLAIGVLVTLFAGAILGAAVFFVMQQYILHEGTVEWRLPRVKVESGALRGQHRPASDKGIPEYAAFLGVPYAKPPLGELRFKSPRPVEPWDGVRDATLFGPRCIQGSFDKMLGSEDCLHLNVYTPWVQQDPGEEPPKLPVLVHVHGGEMKEGTGNIIRPDYFMAMRLVVVTFNYRLGNFGFLNLDNDIAPGNAGFKDMVAALKWVRRNIHSFGGDPDQVTIQGCSSAAASVHWLTLLPDTEGLFHQAIIKSGSAMMGGLFTEHALDLSQLTLAYLKQWLSSDMTDAELLYETPTATLVIAFAYAEGRRPKNTPETYEPPTVSVERRAGGEEPKLILRDAESYVLQPARSRVPMILGITICEYGPLAEVLFTYDQLPSVAEDNHRLTMMMEPSVIPTSYAQRALGINSSTYPYDFDQVAHDVRTQLFDLTNIDPSCDILCRWRAFMAASIIQVDTVRAIRMHTRESEPVYAYRYEFPIGGLCPAHAWDDKKLWPESEFDVMQLNTTDSVALNVLRQVTLFSNFVKYGKPVPETDLVVLPAEWHPMVKDEPDIFLRIGQNLTLDKGDMVGIFGPFWTSLYEKYREGMGI